VQGDKKKIGVGRKISYDKNTEENILNFAMKLRETEDNMKIPAVKNKAVEFMAGRLDKFKASDGWYKKFSIRNMFNLNNKYQLPKYMPE
jgi:hypothetical protein